MTGTKGSSHSRYSAHKISLLPSSFSASPLIPNKIDPLLLLQTVNHIYQFKGSTRGKNTDVNTVNLAGLNSNDVITVRGVTGHRSVVGLCVQARKDNNLMGRDQGTYDVHVPLCNAPRLSY